MEHDAYEKAAHADGISRGEEGNKKTKWSWPLAQKELEHLTGELQRHKADVMIALSAEN
jgi:hypothetical protein